MLSKVKTPVVFGSLALLYLSGSAEANTYNDGLRFKIYDSFWDTCKTYIVDKIPEYINHKNEVNGLPKEIPGRFISLKKIKYSEIQMDWSDFTIDSKTNKGKSGWFTEYVEPRVHVKTPMIKEWTLDFVYEYDIFWLIRDKIPMRVILKNF